MPDSRNSGLKGYSAMVTLFAMMEYGAYQAMASGNTELGVGCGVAAYFLTSYVNALFAGDQRRNINPESMAERDQNQGRTALSYLFKGHFTAFRDVTNNLRDLTAQSSENSLEKSL